MKNLNELIDQWIGEEIQLGFMNYGNKDENIGYNTKIQDLKSRKQELVEGIVGEIEGLEDKCWGWSGESTIQEIIKTLTGE